MISTSASKNTIILPEDHTRLLNPTKPTPPPTTATEGQQPAPVNRSLITGIVAQRSSATINTKGHTPQEIIKKFGNSGLAAYHYAQIIEKNRKAEEEVKNLSSQFLDLQKFALNQSKKAAESGWILNPNISKAVTPSSLTVNILNTLTLENKEINITDIAIIKKFSDWSENYKTIIKDLQELSKYIGVDSQGNFFIKEESVAKLRSDSNVNSLDFLNGANSWLSYIKNPNEMPIALQYDALRALYKGNSTSTSGIIAILPYLRKDLITQLESASLALKKVTFPLNLIVLAYDINKLSHAKTESELVQSSIALFGTAAGVLTGGATLALHFSGASSALLGPIGLAVGVLSFVSGILASLHYSLKENTDNMLNALSKFDNIYKKSGFEIKDDLIVFHSASEIDFSQKKLTLSPDGIRFHIRLPANLIKKNERTGLEATFTPLNPIYDTLYPGNIDDNDFFNLADSLGYPKHHSIPKIPDIRLLPSATRYHIKINAEDGLFTSNPLTNQQQDILRKLVSKKLLPSSLITHNHFGLANRSANKLWFNFSSNDVQPISSTLKITMDSGNKTYIIPPDASGSYHFITNPQGGTAFITGLPSQVSLSLEDPKVSSATTTFKIHAPGANLKEGIRFEDDGKKKYLCVPYDDGRINKIDITKVKRSDIQLIGNKFTWNVNPLRKTMRLISAEFSRRDKIDINGYLQKLNEKGQTESQVIVNIGYGTPPTPPQSGSEKSKTDLYLLDLKAYSRDTITTLFDRKSNRIIGNNDLYETIDMGSKFIFKSNTENNAYFFNARLGKIHCVSTTTNKVSTGYNLAVLNKDSYIQNLDQQGKEISFEHVVPYGNPEKFSTWTYKFKQGEFPQLTGITGIDEKFLEAVLPPTQKEIDKTISGIKRSVASIADTEPQGKVMNIHNNKGYTFKIRINKKDKKIDAKIESITPFADVFAKKFHSSGNQSHSPSKVTMANWIRVPLTHADNKEETVYVNSQTGKKVVIKNNWQLFSELQSPSKSNESILLFHSLEEKKVFITKLKANGDITHRSVKTKNVVKIMPSHSPSEVLLISTDGKTIITRYNPFKSEKEQEEDKQKIEISS